MIARRPTELGVSLNSFFTGLAGMWVVLGSVSPFPGFARKSRSIEIDEGEEGLLTGRGGLVMVRMEKDIYCDSLGNFPVRKIFSLWTTPHFYSGEWGKNNIVGTRNQEVSALPSISI